MSVTSSMPDSQVPADQPGLGGSSNPAGNGTGIESPTDQSSGESHDQSAGNGVSSDNGLGTGSAGVGDQSVAESEEQSRAGSEGDSTNYGEEGRKPNLLQELMEMLGLDPSERGEGGNPPAGDTSSSGGGGSGSAARGASPSSGGGSSGGAGGGEGAGSGGGTGGAGGGESAAGGGGESGGAGGGDAAPEGEQHAESLDGKVKFHSENPEDAQQLKETFDEMYEGDPDFKNYVDDVIAKHGSMDVTAKDLGGDTAGKAIVDGGQMAIDLDSLDNKEVIAHELMHNAGMDHGPELEAETEEASDMA